MVLNNSFFWVKYSVTCSTNCVVSQVTWPLSTIHQTIYNMYFISCINTIIYSVHTSHIPQQIANGFHPPPVPPPPHLAHPRCQPRWTPPHPSQTPGQAGQHAGGTERPIFLLCFRTLIWWYFWAGQFSIIPGYSQAVDRRAEFRGRSFSQGRKPLAVNKEVVAVLD